MIQLAQRQKQIAETVNQMIEDRNAQLALVETLMKQLAAMTRLQDSDHAAIEVLTTMQQGMPKVIN